MTGRYYVRTVGFTVAAGLIIGRFSFGETEPPPSAPSPTTPVPAIPDMDRPVNAGAIQRTIYVAHHTTAQDLVTLLSQHFDSDPGVRLTAEPNSNLLVIRTPTASAMDDAMKLLSIVDRPLRQVAFRVFVVELTTNPAPAKIDGERQTEVDPAELTGPADAVLGRLKAWAGAGHVASIKKYYLTVPENKIGELTLGETVPMNSGFNMNASTRSATPVVTMRDIGTTISLRPRISASNEIVADVNFVESRISPMSRGLEISKEGAGGPLVYRGALNTRLQTTLSIQDGQSIVAVESKDDSSPMLVVFSASIVAPHAAVKVSAAPGANARSQFNDLAQKGPTTANDDASGRSLRRPPLAGPDSQRVGPTLWSQLRNEKLLQRLKLTEDQQKQEARLRLEIAKAFLTDMSDADHRQNVVATLKKLEQEYLDLLTPEQKQVWADWQEEQKRNRTARFPVFRRGDDQTRPEERSPTDAPLNERE